MYAIVDRATGAQIGRTYQNRRQAWRRAYKLDRRYGATHHIVRVVK